MCAASRQPRSCPKCQSHHVEGIQEAVIRSFVCRACGHLWYFERPALTVDPMSRLRARGEVDQRRDGRRTMARPPGMSVLRATVDHRKVRSDAEYRVVSAADASMMMS